jgi:hypothetical protein
MARPTKDLSQISMLGLISENRLSRNQPLTASKKLIKRNLRQIRHAGFRQPLHADEDCATPGAASRPVVEYGMADLLVKAHDPRAVMRRLWPEQG